MKQMIPGLRARIARFIAERRGNIFILFALALIPIVGGIGIAIDSARGYLVKSKLSNALDAAGLAAARAADPDQIAEDITRYFAANFPDGYLGATITGPNYTLSEDDTVISLSVAASVETTFAKVIGFDDFDVAASAEVTRGTGFADVVLSIDMSGSMGESAGGGQTRIEGARNAALALLDQMFGDKETKPDVQIGLVPWNSKVNVSTDGESFSSGGTTSVGVPAFTNPINDAGQNEVHDANNSEVPLLFEPPNDWNGCVFARYIHDGNNNNDGDTSYGADTFDNKDWPAWEPIGGEEAAGGGGASKKKKKKKKKKAGGYGSGEDQQCLNHGVTPLQNSKSAIADAIEALTNPEGATNIAQGLVWAWRVLMPAEPFTEADPDADPVPYRAIVLLTDGRNCGSEWDAYKGELGDCSGARAELNARLTTIAARVKADGIKIIAIQFANGGGDLEDLMKAVASEPNEPYYFYAPDAAALEDVFNQIGAHITDVRLSR